MEKWRKFMILELFLLFLGILLILSTWVDEIILETQFVPTIVNGLTSCIALIVGFTATSIAIGFSNPRFNLGENIGRIMVIMLVLTFSCGCLYNAYGAIMIARYYEALRYARTGLVIAILVLFDFLGFLGFKGLD